MKIILEKPIKIILNVPSGLEIDYETIGKLIDNIIILCQQDKKPLDDTAIGHNYSCEFVVGKKNKYRAELLIGKGLYTLRISYIKVLTQYEASRAFALPPKEKAMIKEAKKLAKQQLENKKEEKETEKGKIEWTIK